MSSLVPKLADKIGFSLVFIAIFLVIFNDFLGFEGALGLVLLFTIFIKVVYLKNVKTNLDQPEKLFVYAILFYALMIVISSFVNTNDIAAIEKVLGKYNKILYLFAFVYIFHFLIFDNERFEKFILVLTFSVFLMIILELYFVGLTSHLGSLYSNKGTGAWFISSIMLSLIIISFYKLKQNAKRVAIIYLAMSLILLLIILFTSTRSIWVGLFFSFVVLLPILHSHRLIKINLNIAIAFLITIVVMGFVAEKKVKQEFNDAAVDIEKMSEGNFDTSLGRRIVMYGIAIDGILLEPISGLGEVNYKKFFNDLYEQNKFEKDQRIYEKLTSYKQIHNQFLMDAWMKGLLGLVSIMLLILIPLVYFWRSLAHDKASLASIIGIAFIVNSFVFFQFGAVLTYSHGVVFFVIWLVLLMSVVSIEKSKHKFRPE